MQTEARLLATTDGGRVGGERRGVGSLVGRRRSAPSSALLTVEPMMPHSTPPSTISSAASSAYLTAHSTALPPTRPPSAIPGQMVGGVEGSAVAWAVR